MVTPLGFEPRTNGLKVRCSAVELEGQATRQNRASQSYRAPVTLCHTPGNRPRPRIGSAVDRLAVSPTELAIAITAAAAIAGVARRKRLLAPGGAVAATVLGPALVATGGWWLGAILIAFFLTSSLLPSMDREGPARTAFQVLANGGPALAFGLVALAADEPAFLTGAVATIAAATSDTWATELGRRYGGTPVSVRAGRRVPPGTSGAVSGTGTVASVAGAVLIAALAWLLSPLAPANASIGAGQVIAIAAGGVVGSALDTVLGATLQGRFRCRRCGRLAETPGEHAPGHPTRHASGLCWMTNSAVNLIATGAGGIAATVLESLLR